MTTELIANSPVPGSRVPISFARVVRTDAPASATRLTLAVGAARIELTRGFDAKLLREVVAAVGGAP